MKLINPPLTEGGPPVTARPPAKADHEPVPDQPGWSWWTGVGGLLYAEHANGINPPVVVKDVNWTRLLGRIRDANAGRRAQA